MPMLPRRLAAVLFLGLFTFQLLLAGASAACAMADHLAPGDASGGSAMAGMRMDAMAMGASMSASLIADAQPASSSSEPPCDHPASSDQQCQTMAPCAASFLAPDGALAGTAAPHPVAVVVAIVIMPPSATSAPELRPPRA